MKSRFVFFLACVFLSLNLFALQSLPLEQMEGHIVLFDVQNNDGTKQKAAFEFHGSGNLYIDIDYIDANDADSGNSSSNSNQIDTGPTTFIKSDLYDYNTTLDQVNIDTGSGTFSLHFSDDMINIGDDLADDFDTSYAVVENIFPLTEINASDIQNYTIVFFRDHDSCGGMYEWEFLNNGIQQFKCIHTGEIFTYENTWEYFDANTIRLYKQDGSSDGSFDSLANGQAFHDSYIIGFLPKYPQPVNATNHTYNIASATALNGNVLSDHNAGYDPADPYSGIMLTKNVLHGTLTIDNDTGAFTYTSENGYTGLDGFRYRVVTAQGNSDEAVVSINVGFSTDNLPPHVSITTSTYATHTGEVFTLTADARDDDGNIVAYKWYFGDGNTSAMPSITHSYATPGIYKVYCIVTDDKGASTSSFSHAIFVTDPDDANLNIETNNYSINNIGPIANQFSIFMNISDNNDNEVPSLCSDYYFKVVDSSGQTLMNTACEKIDSTPLRYRTDFQLNGHQPLVNASAKICKTSDNSCATLKNLNNINIYGTEFDMRRDAFSFANSAWNKKSKYFLQILNGISSSEKIIEQYLKKADRENFRNSVGGFLHQSEGLCYGMALSAAANFDRRTDNTYWNIGDDFNAAIDAHWDSTEMKIKPPYKPFATTTHSLDMDTDTIRKIMYYFVAQPFYDTNNTNIWVGNQLGKNLDKSAESWVLDVNNVNDSKSIQSILASGKVTDLHLGGRNNNDQLGHRVTLTQFIGFNGSKKWIVYDNNYPFDSKGSNAPFSVHSLDLLYRVNSTNGRLNPDETMLSFTAYDEREFTTETFATNPDPTTYKDSDILHVLRSVQRNVDTTDPAKYFDKRYYELLLRGGEFLSVTAADGTPVPLIENGEQNGQDAVLQHGLLATSLLLPSGQTYNVVAQQDSGADLLDLSERFITSDEHLFETLRYPPLQDSGGQITRITFKIGTDNTDKAVHRSPVSTGEPALLNPSEDFNTTCSVAAPEYFNGITYGADTYLYWNSSEQTTCIVRKLFSAPTSVNDGDLLTCDDVSTAQKSYIDTTLNSNTEYYYSAFNFNSDGTASRGTSVMLDTSKLSLYGIVMDENSNGLPGTVLSLFDRDNHLLAKTTSEARGLYMFHNLNEGNYTLIAQKPDYTIASSERNVTLQSTSAQINFNAVAKPALHFLDHDLRVPIETTIPLRWTFRHIDPAAKVNVFLSSDSSWIHLGYDINITDPFYYSVGPSYDYNMTLRVALSSDDTVNDTIRLRVVSPESEFVEKFFTTLYNREPSNSDVQYYIDIMHQQSAADVANAFFYDELMGMFIGDLYDARTYIDLAYTLLFKRQPTAEEKTRWINDFGQGVSREKLYYTLLQSSEFKQRAEAFGVKAYLQTDIPAAYKKMLPVPIIQYLLF